MGGETKTDAVSGHKDMFGMFNKFVTTHKVDDGVVGYFIDGKLFRE
jgi:hypothetical protein